MQNDMNHWIKTILSLSILTLGGETGSVLFNVVPFNLHKGGTRNHSVCHGGRSGTLFTSVSNSSLDSLNVPAVRRKPCYDTAGII